MNWDNIKSKGLPILKKWWCSLLLIPFVIYSIHQSYWTLNYNIFFAISYDFPFPINFINFLVDNFLLITHEAGHTFFGFFGIRTLTILGGSLFQLILPALILAYFWYNKKKTGMQLSWYLLGFSLIDVAFYAADGGARQLPLIGGLSKEAHDWYNLLSGWGILESDITFGVVFTFIAGICYIVALLLPLYVGHLKNVDLDLKF